MHYLFVVLLAVTSVFLVSIAQVYRLVPVLELKRRARHGDEFSKAIYRVASYGITSQIILWLLIAISTTGFFILIVKSAPVLISLITGAVLILIIFVWIPRSSANVMTKFLAAFLAPVYDRILRYFYPVLKHSEKKIGAITRDIHTGLYEKTDIAELLLRQHHQIDNRVEARELDLLMHALTFNDKAVGDVMIARKKVIAVSAEDKIGPVVLAELHKSGFRYFPVYKNKKDNVVGVFELSVNATSKDGQKIGSLMIQKTMHLHERQLLVMR